MPKEIADFINSRVPGANAVVNAAEAGDASITVDAKHLLRTCEALKNGPYEFNVLQVISGVDFLARAAVEGDTPSPAVEPRIEVNYILASFTKNNELILKVKLPRENPTVESVVSVWKAANFQERETYDMMGVTFTGHPDHRRILCPEDWQGFPLRKDYVAPETYNGMTIYPEAKLNYAEREFGVRQKAEVKGAVTSVDNYTLGERNKN